MTRDDVLLTAEPIATIVALRQSGEETVGVRYRWNTGLESDFLTAPVSEPERQQLCYHSLD
jgi:hypothetical protein